MSVCALTHAPPRCHEDCVLLSLLWSDTFCHNYGTVRPYGYPYLQLPIRGHKGP